MKVKIVKTLLILLFSFSVKCYAQVPPDTSTTQKLIQYIFQPIDKNKIPTGFLEEYGCPILPMATFDGTLTDSNRVDMNLWRALYLQLQTGWTRSTANPLPPITDVNTIIKQNTGSALPTAIPLIIAQYNTVKSNAFSSNLLFYNSSTNQISDVMIASKPSISPYDTKNLFAACPNKMQTISGLNSFIVKPDMIWNNTGKTITQLQIDFANGQGFQTVTIGYPFDVIYTDTGYKKWTVKAVLSDNSILQCYNDYYVLRIPGAASIFQGSETVTPAWGTINPVPGVRNGATVTVNYSRNNFTGTLRKPLIVVEGFDISFRLPLLNDYTAEDIIAGFNEPFSQGYNFNQQLDDIAGYDLVFVNFTDGAADIVLNAGTVQEVINQVNLNKVLDNRFGNIRQQNVVMGVSMGGLCARYALANMTKNFPGTPTETRLLITHDSPHKGANVPLGLQYLIRMIGGAELFGYTILDIFPQYNDAVGILGYPATTQLLTYTSTSANTFTANNFLNTTYRNMVTFAATGPQPTYRFIATSLGNECAHPVYNPYTQLLNINLDAFIAYFPLITYRLHTIAEVYALPATGSTNKIARFKLSSKFKLFGFITIAKDYYNNTAYAPGSQLAIDGVPGAVTEFATTNVPSIHVTVPLPPILGFLGYVSVNTSGTPGKFTFVPTASALDAEPYTTPVFSQQYVNGTNQNYPSTAETFIAQQTVPGNPLLTNNVHISFTARNSRWLFNEMQNLPNLENCSAECTNPYYIAGPDQLCTSGTYTVPGLQRGVAITWSVSPAGLVTPSGTGNAVTLTRIGSASGVVTLTADLGAGCGPAQSISKQISIGTTITGYYTISSNYHQPLQRPLYVNNSPIWLPANQAFGVNAVVTGAGLTSITWTRDASSYPFNWGTTGATLYFSGNAGTVPYTQRNGIFTVTAQGTCGTATQSFMWPVIVQNWFARVLVSPNPVGNNLNITFSDQADPEATSKQQGQELQPVRSMKSAGITIVTLFELNTNLQVKQWIQKEVTSKAYNFDVAGLRKGMYLMQVDRDNETTTTKIIIK